MHLAGLAHSVRCYILGEQPRLLVALDTTSNAVSTLEKMKQKHYI